MMVKPLEGMKIVDVKTNMDYCMGVPTLYSYAQVTLECPIENIKDVEIYEEWMTTKHKVNIIDHELVVNNAEKINKIFQSVDIVNASDLCSHRDVKPNTKDIKIKSISYNDKMVVVVFDDNTKIMKTVSEGDNFDLNIGVALAYMEKVYGSKRKFHEAVKEIAVNNKEKKQSKKAKKEESKKEVSEIDKLRLEYLAKKAEYDSAMLAKKKNKKAKKETNK